SVGWAGLPPTRSNHSTAACSTVHITTITAWAGNPPTLQLLLTDWHLAHGRALVSLPQASEGFPFIGLGTRGSARSTRRRRLGCRGGRLGRQRQGARRSSCFGARG